MQNRRPMHLLQTLYSPRKPLLVVIHTIQLLHPGQELQYYRWRVVLVMHEVHKIVVEIGTGPVPGERDMPWKRRLR